MTIGTGIALSFVAMLCWGFGDFLIQKSTRKVGDWEALFFISAFGAIVLLPFVWSKLPALLHNGSQLTVLIAASLILFIAGILDFEALRRGKLAIIEPIWSLEVPVAAIFAYTILGESVTTLQFILIAVLLIFLILVAIRNIGLGRSFFMEKGIIVATVGGILMGAANFFMGWGGRVSDPIMMNFVSDLILAMLTLLYLIATHKIPRMISDIRNNYGTLLPMSISDKVAWLAYVFSMSLAPIAVATALSESYIIVAVLLGIFVNREKIHIHQKVGLIGAIIVALILAMVTAG